MGSGPATATAAQSVATQNYHRALSQIEAGRPMEAMNLAEHGGDSVLTQVIQGYAMALPGNDFTFDESATFIRTHPDWPGLKGILMITEQKLPQDLSAQQVVNWFNANPPTTAAGFYRYIDALESTGAAQKAADLVRDRWITRDFPNDEGTVFYSRFGNMLTMRDHYARLDDLLWDNKTTAARQMFRFVDEDVRALAEARIAFANQSPKAQSLLANVPAKWRNDPGLLYERLRWLRQNGADSAAVDLLLKAPTRLVRPDEWWKERHIIIRRLIEKHDYRTAYRLAAAHGLANGQNYAQAEFLAGWLALRFLKNPEQASEHFDNLTTAATTPISRARGAYWQGRALEALGDKNEAQQAYETAAALNTTFYGLLAATRLFAKPMVSATPEPVIPTPVRNSFTSRTNIQAIERLYAMGETDRARSFFKAATDAASQRVEFVLLTEVAYRLRRPDWAITAAKAANQKNMILAANAYPVLAMTLPAPPDRAFTHALIRQESLFNADAGSPVGARGLMQLMPRTAQETAKKLGMKYTPARLTEPDYNVRLGTAYIQAQLDAFDGSYILALAAYNAGAGRVKEWISTYGDPRTSAVDPVDWLEAIPIYETRNYVQRIMENFQVYRARLNNGQAPLTLMQDLRR